MHSLNRRTLLAAGLAATAVPALAEDTTWADVGPREARCTLEDGGETLEISAVGALGGRAFYAPGEAYTFLGATDEPDGEVLLIPARSSTPLTLSLCLAASSASPPRDGGVRLV